MSDESLQVGQRVEVTGEYDGKNFNRHVGKIVSVNGTWSYGIEFDEDIHGHDCGGKAKYHYGYNVSKSLIKPIKNKGLAPGDKVIIKEDGDGECGTLNGLRYDYIQVDSMYTDNQLGRYTAYKSNGDFVAACSGCLHSYEVERYVEPHVEPHEETKSVESTPLSGMDGTTVSHTTTGPVSLSSIRSISQEFKKPPEVVAPEPVYTKPVSTAHGNNIRKLMGLRNHKNRSAVSE